MAKRIREKSELIKQNKMCAVSVKLIDEVDKTSEETEYLLLEILSDLKGDNDNTMIEAPIKDEFLPEENKQFYNNLLNNNEFIEKDGLVYKNLTTSALLGLGLTKEEDPVKIEFDLMKELPKDYWILWNIHIIRLGRTICKAPTPKCEECFLAGVCPSCMVDKKKK